jgi:pimeloyl-ACP methyl ester carboxylesterase
MPDIPGELGKSAEIRLLWNNNDYILWLDDLLNKLNLKEVFLVGISFGGWIAAKYTAYKNNNVKKLLLLTPGGIIQAKHSAILKTIIYSMSGKWGAKKLKQIIFGKNEITKEVLEFYDLLQENYIYRYGSIPLLNNETLEKITVPVCMIVGSNDVFYDANKVSKRLKKSVSNYMEYIIPEAEHALIDMGKITNGFLK